jgi:hypothetical protein
MLNREGRPSLPERFGAIATALASGAVAGETGAMLGGYAASGDSVRGAIETLAAAVPMSVVDDGAVLRLSDAVPAPVAVAADEQGASAEEKGGPRVTTERTASGALPDEVAIAYYEPARDYQTGLQRARLGGPGRRVEKLELPAALTSEEAKAIAERRLAESWAGRRTATLALPWRACAAGGRAAAMADRRIHARPYGGRAEARGGRCGRDIDGGCLAGPVHVRSGRGAWRDRAGAA